MKYLIPQTMRKLNYMPISPICEFNSTDASLDSIVCVALQIIATTHGVQWHNHIRFLFFWEAWLQCCCVVGLASFDTGSYCDFSTGL
ncbi:hypothetical protein Mapa_007485 [Marchantia paleacea]|nr:hypothetical protein Mapa_007485 [Marchantia paleacea]